MFCIGSDPQYSNSGFIIDADDDDPLLAMPEAADSEWKGEGEVEVLPALFAVTLDRLPPRLRRPPAL